MCHQQADQDGDKELINTKAHSVDLRFVTHRSNCLPRPSAIYLAVAEKQNLGYEWHSCGNEISVHTYCTVNTGTCTCTAPVCRVQSPSCHLTNTYSYCFVLRCTKSTVCGIIIQVRYCTVSWLTKALVQGITRPLRCVYRYEYSMSTGTCTSMYSRYTHVSFQRRWKQISSMEFQVGRLCHP